MVGRLLCLLLKCGHFEIVKFLVENGADPNVKDDFYGRTTLMFASQKGHFEIVKFLIENGADANTKDDFNGENGSYVCF